MDSCSGSRGGVSLVWENSTKWYSHTLS